MEAHERFAIVLEGQKESNTISEVCKKYNISRDTYYRWKREMKEAAELYWEEKSPGRKSKDHFETKAEAQEAYREKEKELSEKEEEILKLKKELEGATIQRDFYRFRLKHHNAKKNSKQKKNDG